MRPFPTVLLADLGAQLDRQFPIAKLRYLARLVDIVLGKLRLTWQSELSVRFLLFLSVCKTDTVYPRDVYRQYLCCDVASFRSAC